MTSGVPGAIKLILYNITKEYVDVVWMARQMLRKEVDWVGLESWQNENCRMLKLEMDKKIGQGISTIKNSFICKTLIYLYNSEKWINKYIQCTLYLNFYFKCWSIGVNMNFCDMTCHLSYGQWYYVIRYGRRYYVTYCTYATLILWNSILSVQYNKDRMKV